MKTEQVLLVILVIYIIFFGPIFKWDIVMQAVLLMIIAQLLWMSRIFNLALSSLIVLTLLSFHFFSFKESVRFIGSEIVWLLFATYILAGAFLKSGLSLRISLHILKFSRGNGKLLLLMAFFMMIVLAFLVPTNVGRTSLIVTIIVGMLAHLEKLNPVSNMGKSLMIGLNYFVILSGTLIVTGSNSSIYAFGILSSISDMNWNYITWSMIFFPPVMLFMIVLWIILLWLFPVEKLDEKKVLIYMESELNKLGRFSKSESKLTLIALFVFTFWAFGEYHPYSIPMIGMIGAILTLFPFTGIWNWSDAKECIDWDTLIFFAASLALSNMLMQSGALEKFAEVFITGTSMFNNEWIIISLLGLLAILLRMVFLNVIGFMTIMLPLALIVGEELNRVSPIVVALIVFVVGNPGFFLVTQTPVNMMTHRYGYYRESDLCRAGILPSILLLGIVLLTGFFYWSLFKF